VAALQETTACGEDGRVGDRWGHVKEGITTTYSFMGVGKGGRTGGGDAHGWNPRALWRKTLVENGATGPVRMDLQSRFPYRDQQGGTKGPLVPV
jgi:hypothetical protein